jgi:flagellar protein FliO/FliZ
LAVLIVAAGLFVFVPVPLSAQDGAAASAAANTQAAVTDTQTPVPRDPRAAEQTMLLGETPPPGTAALQGPSSIFVILRMILVLVFAAAAIYGVVWFIKRSSRRTDPKDPNLRVLSSVHLGLNRYVHIVSVGSRAWLLGAADGGVNLITEVEDKDVVNAMLLEDSQKSAAGPGGALDFKSLLRRFGLAQDGSVPQADNIRKRRERLKGL